MAQIQIVEWLGAGCQIATGLPHPLHPESWQALFGRRAGVPMVLLGVLIGIGSFY